MHTPPSPRLFVEEHQMSWRSLSLSTALALSLAISCSLSRALPLSLSLSPSLSQRKWGLKFGERLQAQATERFDGTLDQKSSQNIGRSVPCLDRAWADTDNSVQYIEFNEMNSSLNVLVRPVELRIQMSRNAKPTQLRFQGPPVHLFTPRRSLGTSYRRVLREC